MVAALSRAPSPSRVTPRVGRAGTDLTTEAGFVSPPDGRSLGGAAAADLGRLVVAAGEPLYRVVEIVSHAVNVAQLGRGCCPFAGANNAVPGGANFSRIPRAELSPRSLTKVLRPYEDLA